MKNIYLAGKIDCDAKSNSMGWRKDLLSVRRNFSKAEMTVENFFRDHPFSRPCDVFEMTGDLAGLGYGGPFINYRQHECFDLKGHSDGDTTRRLEVKAFSLFSIQKSQIFFAWLNAPDAYGTIYEIAYAQSLNMPVIIGVDEGLSKKVRDDLWFVLQDGAGVESYCYHTKTAKEALLLGLEAIGEYLPSLPYAEYLKTSYWKAKAKEARLFASNKCQLCNSDNKPLHVHHRTYERRGFETMADLTVLCEKCHKKFHNKEE